jgi:hypothetical protein
MQEQGLERVGFLGIVGWGRVARGNLSINRNEFDTLDRSINPFTRGQQWLSP